MQPPAGFELTESYPDSAAYHELFSTTGWNEEYKLTAEELDHAIRRSWYFLAAYENGQLVGAGRIVSDGAFHALIVDVIVRPSHQRRGLGTAIVRRLLARCQAGRIRDVQLFCARGKEPFYRQLGFVPRPAESPGMDFKNS
jgi:GNAT superfamily N-acetyltransferase